MDWHTWSWQSKMLLMSKKCDLQHIRCTWVLISFFERKISVISTTVLGMKHQFAVLVPSMSRPHSCHVTEWLVIHFIFLRVIVLPHLTMASNTPRGYGETSWDGRRLSECPSNSNIGDQSQSFFYELDKNWKKRNVHMRRMRVKMVSTWLAAVQLWGWKRRRKMWWKFRLWHRMAMESK